MLTRPQQPFHQELERILHYWQTHTVDTSYGGFYGRLDQQNRIVTDAPKGAVLNARILWTFSAAYRYQPNPDWRLLAARAQQYIMDHFIDTQSGGAFWSLTHDGKPLETKKQIYALAFMIYGLTEYHLAFSDSLALDTAILLYHDIGTYSHDPLKGGYIEAFSRDWQPIHDLRLSDKDANEKKTMNTHLHVLEAYTNLYRCWPDPRLADRIRELIGLFTSRITNPSTGHLQLFFDEDWTPRSSAISFGHEIEASWLLTEAAVILGDTQLIENISRFCLLIARASTEGLQKDGGNGGMACEYDPVGNHWNNERHWWVQAEAMVGLLNAWELNNDPEWLTLFFNMWKYTSTHLLDIEYGEWHWGRLPDGSLMNGEDKAGFWKCPYHNSRACLEIIRRLDRLHIIVPE